MFVNELNQLWNGLAAIGASSQTFPAPSVHGWHNTNVLVALSGSGGSVQATISRVFGETNTTAAALASYLLSTEGTNTVRFHTVGALGKRSPTRLTDVLIDKTAPTITGGVDRPPDRGRWYRSPVTLSFLCSDQLSGITSCPSDVVLATSGADQSATGLTTDGADNIAGLTITNINIDLSGPTIRATANRPILRHVGAKVSFGSERERYNVSRLVPVVISGAITDRLSGVNPSTAFCSVHDEYDRIEPNGRIVLDAGGRFSFTLRLESVCARGDENGREYFIRLRSADRAGHSSDKSLKVTVRP
jgi:hypothetical protein